MSLVCSAFPGQNREPPALSATGGRALPCDPLPTPTLAAASYLTLLKVPQVSCGESGAQQVSSAADEVACPGHGTSELDSMTSPENSADDDGKLC
jgi:hypothetical protein